MGLNLRLRSGIDEGIVAEENRVEIDGISDRNDPFLESLLGVGNIRSSEEGYFKREREPTVEETYMVLARSFLEAVSANPGSKVTETYDILELSDCRGDKVKKYLEGKGFIRIEETRDGRKGRLAKRIYLTNQGKEVLIKLSEGEVGLEVLGGFKASDEEGKAQRGKKNKKKKKVSKKTVNVQGEEVLWKVDDVAEYLNISASTVYRRISIGEMACYKVGGLNRFKREEIYEMVKNNRKDNSIQGSTNYFKAS